MSYLVLASLRAHIHICTYMHAYTQTRTEVCSWITGVCIPDNCYKLGCVMLFMFINNLKLLQIHKNDKDMKIRTCFIMKFVYFHNVIMYWNNIKPLLLMLHFTPAINTTTVTRENKTRRCPWQRHFAQAQFTLRRSAIEKIPVIWVNKMNWSVISHTLCFPLAPPYNPPVELICASISGPSYLFFDQFRCHYAVHDCNVTVQ